MPPDNPTTLGGCVVIECAERWWRSRRPIGWTIDDHLAQPVVNCVDAAEIALARAVARGMKPT